MIRLAMMLGGLFICLSACSAQGFKDSGERWRDSLCRQKYGHDCIDPGEPRRGPPDHNDPESVP